MESAFNSFPTSFAQRRLWFLQTLSPASCAYNMLFSTVLPFVPVPELMQRTIDALVDRHETLRTGFALEDGEPAQRVYASGSLRVQGIGADESPESFARAVGESLGQPFVLTEAPLARVLLHPSADRPQLALVIHHSIADGHTIRILVEEMLALYQAFATGSMPVLPALPVQYADYAVWQRRSLTGSRLLRLRDYWLKRLDALPELNLHHDVAPASAGAGGGVLPFRIPAAVVARMRALAIESRATLFAALLAGFAVVLARFSGQADFAIGTPVSGRMRAELERIAGLFVNSLVFRSTVSPEQSFAQLVRRTGAALAEDLAHQELPFEELVEMLGARRRADRNPIFQVMMQLQTGAGASADAAASPEPDRINAQLDLSLIQYERADGQVEGWAVYAGELFSPQAVGRMVEAYLLVLAEGSRAPGTPVGDLPLLSGAAQQHVLALGRGGSRDWPVTTRLSDWLTDQARASPRACAVVDGGEAITFESLDERARQVACGLLARDGIAPGSIVAVCLPRSIDLVAAIAGVLQAGGAYLFLDPDSPRQRHEFLLADSGAVAVIVPEGREELAAGRRALVMTRLPEPGELPVCRSCAQDAAYVIYTSGSTGEPKGVSISHRAIVNHMRWMLETFPLQAGDRVLQRTPLTFDASVWELFAPLLSGATLVLEAPRKQFDPGQLIETLRRERINVLQVVPSLLRALVAQGGLDTCSDLRQVFCGGEPLTRTLCEAFFAQSRAALCNLYGPTETTIDATFHVVTRGATASVPIGRPISNVVVRVLDEKQRPVPEGVLGELYIGGAAVGIGYLGRPQLTQERFIDDPFDGDARLFRTGDRVRLRRDGEVEYVGRVDAQVKLRGFRIELTEIDAVLLRHPAVAEAATVVQDHGEGDQRLIAFCTPSKNDAANLEPELRAWLRSRLPAHEVPSMIVVQATLPKSVHGKVDRAALGRTPVTRSDSLRPGPRNPIERRICETFGDVLHSEEVAIDDNFFLLGGHSLLVINVCEHLTKACETPVSVVDVYEYPTPRQLAAVLASRATAA